MMKKILIMMAALTITLGALSVVQAAGQDPNQTAKNTGEYAGERCDTPAKGSGVVAGFFRGWAQTGFQDRGDGLMPVERYRCFKTLPQCQAWMKTMTYLYNEKSIEAHICKQF